MLATARRGAELAATPVRVFFAVRRTRSVLVATVLCGALTAWLGTVDVPVPTISAQGPGRIPIWRILAMGAAVLPVLAVQSHLASLEEGVTQTLRRMRRIHLAAMAAGCASIYLSIAALTLHPLIVVVMTRSWLAWYGLALLAGVLIGWRNAWTLPATVAIILWYWGHQGGEYRWWEFSARPHDDLPSLLLSVAFLAAGLVARSATPWRRHRLRTALRRKQRPQSDHVPGTPGHGEAPADACGTRRPGLG